MRVIVTRPAEQAEELAVRLRELGHDPIVCPLVRVEPLGDEPVETAGYDWVVVTSSNGAFELARRRSGALPRVAAIGPGTAAALREHGIEPALVPRVSTQEGLLAELPRPPGRVLFAGAEGARRLLAEQLEAEFVPLYRTVELRPPRLPDGDLVVLASPSAARACARSGLALPAVSIGPHTTEAAREVGIEIVAEAATHDLEGLVIAVAQAVQNVNAE
jgi:uroporphyrinogen III methyltransferase/synthase